jgi:hypothetical protein
VLILIQLASQHHHHPAVAPSPPSIFEIMPSPCSSAQRMQPVPINSQEKKLLKLKKKRN